MALKTSIALTINTTLTAATAPLGAAATAALAPYGKLVELASGTAVGQADKLYYAQRTLIASTSEDLDLTGLLLDAFGVAIPMARIKALAITALKTNTNNVIVGAAAGNQWVTLLNAAGTLTLRPEATVCVFAGASDATGYVVTAGTGDLLKVLNGGAGTPVDYEIVIIGASA